MKLVIGGYAQGKLTYVLQENSTERCLIFDGRLPETKQVREVMHQGGIVIINHFHNWVKERISRGENPEEEIAVFLKQNIESIIICDEIGNGIVPMEAFEREYREKTGRILVKLAKEADEVVRVLCGMGQKIK